MTLLRPTIEVLKHDVNGVPYVTRILQPDKPKDHAATRRMIRENMMREVKEGGNYLPVEKIELYHEMKLLNGEV